MAERIEIDSDLISNFLPTEEDSDSGEDNPIAPPPSGESGKSIMDVEDDDFDGDAEDDQEGEDEEETSAPKQKKKSASQQESDSEEGSDEDGDQTESDEDSETDSEAGQESSFKLSAFQAQLEGLVEQGVIDVPEEVDDSEEGFKAIIKQTVNQRLDKELDKKFEHLDGEEKKLLDYIREGGSIRKYFENANEVDFEDLDMDHEDSWEMVVTEAYRQQGFSDDKIVRKLQKLKENDELEEEAKDFHQVLSERQKKEKAQRLEEEKKQKEEYRKQIEHAQKEFQDAVFNTKELMGQKMDKKEQQAFWNYLTKPVKDGKTQAQLDDLKEDGKANLDTLLKVNYMKFKGFDLKAAEESGKRKAIVNFKKNTSRASDSSKNPKTTTARTSSGSGGGGKFNLDQVIGRDVKFSKQ